MVPRCAAGGACACTAMRALVRLLRLAAFLCSHSRAGPAHKSPRRQARQPPWGGCFPIATASKSQQACPRASRRASRAFVRAKRIAARATRAGVGVLVFSMEIFDRCAAGALLLDVPTVAQMLGFSVYQARRFLAAPPADFPAPLRVGARIFVRRPQLEAWARGELVAAPPAPEVQPDALRPQTTSRPRGRPRKVEVARGRG